MVAFAKPLVIILAALAAASPAWGKREGAAMSVQTSAFEPGKPIPQKFTADGENISPRLKFSGIPAAAKELALIVDDPDAPRPQPWVHWVLYKLPPSVTELPEHLPADGKLAQPAAVQGKNSWGSLGYRGPEPPRGHGVHHYHFKLYALDAPLPQTPGLDKDALLKAMQGHILSQSEVVGTYHR